MIRKTKQRKKPKNRVVLAVCSGRKPRRKACEADPVGNIRAIRRVLSRAIKTRKFRECGRKRTRKFGAMAPRIEAEDNWHSEGVNDQ